MRQSCLTGRTDNLPVCPLKNNVRRRPLIDRAEPESNKRQVHVAVPTKQRERHPPSSVQADQNRTVQSMTSGVSAAAVRSAQRTMQSYCTASCGVHIEIRVKYSTEQYSNTKQRTGAVTMRVLRSFFVRGAEAQSTSGRCL